MLSQFTPEQPEDITLANFYHFEKDVYPVGRLDKDSEGLLLLTNDSALNQKILHPKKTILKTYWVQVEGHATQLQLQQLWQGVTINVNGKAHITQPCKAKLLPSESVQLLPERNPPIRIRINIPTTWLSIEICEGKNRQVRKMCAKVGLPVLRLVRYAIGNLTISDLQHKSLITFDKHQIF